MERAYFGGTGSLLLGELDGEAEIGQLHVTSDVEKYVIRLNISVDDVPLMQEVQPQQSLIAHVLDNVLRVLSISDLDHISDTPVHQFNDNPVASLVVEDVFGAQDRLTLVKLHEADFVLNRLLLFLRRILHQLHREFFLVSEALHLVNSSLTA